MADPADDAMVGKKAIADYCPPSIFTGKTRLYVQALYGAPLYTEDVKDAEGNITKAGVPAESIVSYDEGIGGTPSIKLAPYRAEGDTAEYSPVVLTTGAGVFLDPVTGKHWLFGTGGSGVSVYPLRASPEATKLRRLLKIPAKGKPVLSIVDREHLEAYILSTCRPDVKNVQYLPFPTSINTWSLGYSWHWNWTGLTADIVNNEDFFQGFFPGGPCYAMRSTHRRLAITPSQLPEGGTEFTVSVSVVEGPKEWAVERALWCLTEPYWANGSSLKVTPRRTKIFACDAPFYAFYIRDQLKVCRVSVTEGFDYSERITSPGFDSSIAGPYYTEGAGGGFGESKSFSGTYYAASFSCGGKSFSSLHAYRSESGTLDVISGKGEGDPFWGTVDVFRAPGFSVSVGSPGNYSEFTYNGSSVNVWYNRLIPMSYTHKASTTSTTYPSRATLVVPHKNAEAFYMEGYSASIRTETGVTVTALSGGLFGQKTQYVEVDFFTGAELGPRLVTAGYYTGGVAYAGATVTGTTNPDDIVTTSVSLSEGVLISHAGVTSARFADDIYFNRFHDDDYEEVPSDFKTLSGTSVAAPVVIANIYINPAIGTSVVPGMPALVGWV